VPVNLVGPEMKVGSTYSYAGRTILLAVPSGPFLMGQTGSLDYPQHTVTLSDFWIYSTKVTNRQYAGCVGAAKCDPPDLTDDPGYADLRLQNDPVVGVTYADAAAHCNFVHGQLPTEAQWETTARGPDEAILSGWWPSAI
jgi:formylglycine-generating enzyme required for sulfatase activity